MNSATRWKAFIEWFDNEIWKGVKIESKSQFNVIEKIRNKINELKEGGKK